MSTDLPFLEAQVDALVNTIWWTLEEKLGRTTRPPIRHNPSLVTKTLDDLTRIWDSVAMRTSLAFFFPHFLKSFVEIDKPYRMSVILVLFCIVCPWIYQIFIYLPFLDPLRHLPSPKVIPLNRHTDSSSGTRSLVSALVFPMKTYLPLSLLT